MLNRTTLRHLDNQPTFASTLDALQASRLDWQVDLEPLTTASGHAADARAVVRADTRRPLGVVGLRYTPCDNRTATSWLDQYVKHGLKITGAEAFKRGERCVMYGTLGERPAEVAPGDLVALQVVVSWSHDGSSSTTATLQALRLVCRNGLCLASDAGRMFSIRHTRNADPNAEEIQAQVREALGRFNESIAAYQQLARRQVTRQQVREYTRAVMEFPTDVTGEMSSRSANVLDSIVARYGQTVAGNVPLVDAMVANWEGAGIGQEMNGGGTWWNAFNAITEHLTHDRGRTAESRQESLLFGTSARINERALNIAIQLANAA